MIKTFKKGESASLSEHFRSCEFDCKCAFPECTLTLIDTDLVDKLEKMRALIDYSLRVDSGFRCRAHQLALAAGGRETAIGVSQHELGKAADVISGAHDGATLEKAARTAGFQAVGVAPSWVHVDLRADRMRQWSYTK